MPDFVEPGEVVELQRRPLLLAPRRRDDVVDVLATATVHGLKAPEQPIESVGYRVIELGRDAAVRVADTARRPAAPQPFEYRRLAEIVVHVAIGPDGTVVAKYAGLRIKPAIADDAVPAGKTAGQQCDGVGVCEAGNGSPRFFNADAAFDEAAADVGQLACFSKLEQPRLVQPVGKEDDGGAPRHLNI